MIMNEHTCTRVGVTLWRVAPDNKDAREYESAHTVTFTDWTHTQTQREYRDHRISAYITVL